MEKYHIQDMDKNSINFEYYESQQQQQPKEERRRKKKTLDIDVETTNF